MSELAQDIDRLRELYRNLSIRQENTTPSLLSVFAAMLTAIAQAEEASYPLSSWIRQENTTPSLLSVFAAMLTAIAQAEEALSAIVR